MPGMQQCKVVQSGIAGSAFVVCQAEWPNMVVSLPKRQQRGATAAPARMGGICIFCWPSCCVFLSFACLLLGTVFGHLAGAENSARGRAGQGRPGGGDSQPFGSLHKIKIKAKVRLLPVTRR